MTRMPTPSSTHAVASQRRRAWVLGLLAVAVVAMMALHGIQPALHPLEEPVSFYVHGRSGWLLPVSLGAFAAAVIVLGSASARAQSRRARRSLRFFGGVILVTALVPSDRWFPWEHEPTVAGVIHATAAMVAPLLLLDAMIAWAGSGDRPLAAARALLVVAYALGVVASAASLAVGFAWDGSPPLIGLAERLLAISAVAWLTVSAWTRA